MKAISADYVFTNTMPPIKDGMIVIDEKGSIIDITVQQDNYDITRYEGVICPGFVNVHCHLELSHLKGKIPEKEGLATFIGKVVDQRKYFEGERHQKMVNAIHEMDQNGIVAVGDICNGKESFYLKASSNLVWHSFIELFSLQAEEAEEVIKRSIDLKKEHDHLLGKRSRSSLVPHAPYSVSDRLFSLLATHNEKDSVISMHNQESSAENELFETSTGSLFQLFRSWQLAPERLNPKKLSSLKYVEKLLRINGNMIFVHNTFTSADDITVVNQKYSNIFWCLCPNANLYIENRLPDLSIFLAKDQKMVLGTDSLASNHQLCILEEMKTLNAHFNEITLSQLILWATKNGAEALKLDDQFGSLTIGKQPGINLIQNVDLHNMKLTPQSKVRKVI